jgi:MoaA/NifB/PqqE/SkfB family radical SAM enzyme
VIVLWRITERCNFACGFCAYDRRLKRPRAEVSEADALRLGAVLAAYGRASGQRVMISWLGGEPLLWAPLFAVSESLRADGLAISLTTNGSLLHLPDIQERLLATVDELTVSVDAGQGLHDRLRGFDGAWRRCREGVSALRHARTARGGGPKLRANVVLMRSTLPEFESLCADLADWGVDEITFNQLGGRDRPEFFPAERLTPGDIAELRSYVDHLKGPLAERGVRLCAAPRYLDRLDAAAVGDPWPVDECGMGQDFLFIDEAGLIAPCSFSTAEYGVPKKGVHTAADLDRLPTQFRAAKKKTPCATCADCPSTQVSAKFGT